MSIRPKEELKDIKSIEELNKYLLKNFVDQHIFFTNNYITPEIAALAEKYFVDEIYEWDPFFKEFQVWNFNPLQQSHRLLP